MGRLCKICSHDQRDDIERDIFSQVGQREIARRYETFSQKSVSRHASKCIPELLARARKADEVAHADGLLEDVATLRNKTFAVLDAAEGAEDWATVLRAVREARDNVRILAELRGRLDTQPTINVLMNNPVWMRLEGVVVDALEPYPEARHAVVRALEVEERRD